MIRTIVFSLLAAFPAIAGNAQNCTARREACRTLTVLCASGSPAACARADRCWSAVWRDCGK